MTYSLPPDPPPNTITLGVSSPAYGFGVGDTNTQSICVHAQSWLTLCNPMDYSPPGSSVHWIFQARVLEWVAISSSRGSSRPRDWTHVISCISCIGRWILYHTWKHTWSKVSAADVKEHRQVEHRSQAAQSEVLAGRTHLPYLIEFSPHVVR